MKIGIIGAGNTGVACATHLTDAGYEAVLFTRSDAKQSALREGIEVSGAANGKYSFDAVTDIAQMLRRVNIVIICTWANAHSEVFTAIREALASQSTPHDDNNESGSLQGPIDIIVFNGNWGAYKAYAQLGENPSIGCIAETSGMPYVANMNFDGTPHLHLSAIKTTLTASFTTKNSIAQNVLHDLYEDVKVADSLFETSLMAPNPIIHAPLCLLNMTKIETGEQFSMLTDGFSERTEHLVAHIDRERAALAEAIGCGYEPILEQLNEQWGSNYHTLKELFQSNPVYSSLQGPSNTDHRFIQEDIPFGIAPLASLGTSLHVPTPACSTMLSMYSMYFNQTFTGPEFDTSVITRLRRKLQS
ncbi:NAD/NADP octopine/nopaline dehydrogenase family protein [Bifidobacterium sp.]|jgi:opine dehydrogenase|uniref:NAD/NADP octopine/nopaline dehydrogenase family protein n=1 Tax=Bifidobacterium sp. TaxID=41200 RepID=UPI0025C0C195|nr:NAD/NADP octopine/nopaline dehydrogenase family protein [Bifidobacterium sp.]MCI1634613.1 NAD/NADP octopine/nopaline dehydrogenase family protein [Bifidobacterium sp.]